MAGKSSLQWVIGATDNASKVFDKVGKNIDQTTTKTERLRQASQLLGAAAIVGFAAASVKAYADAEQAQAKLQEAYRKFPKLADVNIEAFRALNTAIQDKTGSDDDDLAAAEANLAMFGLTGTQIKQLIPLVNDLAVAKGIGLTEASASVGKAMLGNAKALKDVGIQFKATGDKAKDFGTITDALSAQVGGAGDAFGKTAAGGMARAQKSFSDLQEEVGKQLVPALSTVLQAVLPVMRAFNGLSDAVKGPIVWVGVLGAAALVLVPKLLGIVANMKLIQANSLSAAAALEAEAAAAAAAGGASATAAPKVATLGKALGVVGAVLAVLQAGQWLSDKIGDTAATSDEATKAFESLSGAALDANTSLKEFGGSGGTLGEALDAAFNPSVLSRINHAVMWVASLGGNTPTMQESGDVIGRMQVQFSGLDAGLAAMVANGNVSGAAAKFREIEIAAAAAGYNIEELKSMFPEYASAVGDATGATDGLTDSISEQGAAAQQWTPALRAYWEIIASGTDEAARATARDEAASLRRTDAEIAGAAALRASAAAAHAAHVAHQANIDAAQAALATWNETISAYTSARDALTSLTEARAAEVKAIGDQLTASGHLNAVFDMNAYTAATNRATTARTGLADAEKAVRDARKDVGRAKTPDELNAAVNAEVQANKALAASRAEVAAADKAKAAAALTPKNLLSSIRSKLSNIKSFYADLTALRKRKLPMSLIRQLIDAGPIEGDQLAKALLSATPSDFNAIVSAEAQLDRFGARIGGIVGDYDYNGLIAGQRGVVANARANAVAAGNQVVQFQMFLDGREVAVALKAYRASVGGAPLGLG